MKERETARNEKNTDELANELIEDVESVSSNGKTIRGRKALKTQYTSLFKDPQYANSTTIQRVTQLRIISGQLAIVDGEWDLTLPVGVKHGKSQIILAKGNGGWRIASIRSSERNSPSQ